MIFPFFDRNYLKLLNYLLHIYKYILNFNLIITKIFIIYLIIFYKNLRFNHINSSKSLMINFHFKNLMVLKSYLHNYKLVK